MLKGIDPLLGPELLMALRSMGHGDEIAIVDANYPAATHSKRLIRLDGSNATRALQAVLSVLPIDTYVDQPVQTMQVVGDLISVPDVVEEYHQILSDHNILTNQCAALERFQFYERVRNAFVVIGTGELRLYGNIILKKGVLGSGV